MQPRTIISYGGSMIFGCGVGQLIVPPVSVTAGSWTLIATGVTFWVLTWLHAVLVDRKERRATREVAEYERLKRKFEGQG